MSFDDGAIGTDPAPVPDDPSQFVQPLQGSWAPHEAMLNIIQREVRADPDLLKPDVDHYTVCLTDHETGWNMCQKVEVPIEPNERPGHHARTGAARSAFIRVSVLDLLDGANAYRDLRANGVRTEQFHGPVTERATDV